MPKSKRVDARFCQETCRKSAAAKRRRIRAKVTGGAPIPENPDTSLQRYRSDSVARRIHDLGLYTKWRLQEITLEEIADALGAGRAATRKALDNLYQDEVEAKARADWEMTDEVRHMLALDLPMPEDMYDFDAQMAWAIEATDRFLAFEHEFFVVPHERTGKVIPFIRKAFHRVWIIETLLAIATGGYLQILSPPRHGKSQLMAHFSVWLICRDPNIRILWVGPKESTAARFVDLVKIKLESDQLVRRVLPPGKSFRPLKRAHGATWNKGEFVVDCRLETVVGSTMLAVGRGADSILSLNADVIVCDDIENAQSCETQPNRVKTRNWFGIDLDSRKMEHTALLVIGSRQHWDDLYGYNIEDPSFRSVVNSAHDPTCRRDPLNYSLHVDCMLFPELRTYRWLISKKHGAESRESHGTYEMVYLNDPRLSGLTIFNPDDIKACFDPSRILGAHGLTSMPRHVPEARRIAGLDPSATGYQAAVAFACTEIENFQPIDGAAAMFDVQDAHMLRWIIGMDNRLGGGIENFLILAEKWRLELGIYWWVIETKGFQAYHVDPRVKWWARMNDVHIRPHQTEGANKHHPKWGVGATNRLFRDGLVNLPYGNEESRVLAEALKKQAQNFTDEPETQRRRRSDLLMAFWFPQKDIRRWERETITEMSQVQSRVDNPYPTSYPALQGFTTLNQAPWR